MTWLKISPKPNFALKLKDLCNDTLHNDLISFSIVMRYDTGTVKHPQVYIVQDSKQQRP